MTMPTWSSGPSNGGSVRRVETVMPVRPLIHIANLPSSTTERDIREMFGSLGQIQSVKVVTSRSAGALVYGFVEYVDVAAAEHAIHTMDGWLWFGTPIKVCWAKHSMHPDAAAAAAETGSERNVATHSNAGNSHLFVGDLSPEVDDSALHSFFSKFPSLADVRVMYDAETGKSRGFGFISFRSKQEAEACIATMHGQWLAGRQIRVNWASQKNQSQSSVAMGPDSAHPKASQQCTSSIPLHPTAYTAVAASAPHSSGSDSPHLHAPPRRHAAVDLHSQPTNLASKGTYEQVLAETPPSVTSVYVGNVSPLTSRDDLVRVFAPFNHGQPLEARIPAGKGYGFVKLASHEQAASAICTLSIQGVFMHSRWLRFGWQKDREPGTRLTTATGSAPPPQQQSKPPSDWHAY